MLLDVIWKFAQHELCLVVSSCVLDNKHEVTPASACWQMSDAFSQIQELPVIVVANDGLPIADRDLPRTYTEVWSSSVVLALVRIVLLLVFQALTQSFASHLVVIAAIMYLRRFRNRLPLVLNGQYSHEPRDQSGGVLSS